MIAHQSNLRLSLKEKFRYLEKLIPTVLSLTTRISFGNEEPSLLFSMLKNLKTTKKKLKKA